MGSAEECEIESACSNAQESISIRDTLLDLCHPQPLTTTQIDNSTSVGFTHKQIKKRSKSIDMLFR